ncbi:MAG TPA: SAM-dependent methyltransferase [Chitinophagaceae bacterium]|nr:SAM-dependent methyltransferase [Chitinophagaceae bacterium]
MNDQQGKVFLIPILLDEDGLGAIPPYIIMTIKACRVFFVENERTARRYLKKLSKEIVIDEYEWYNMAEASSQSDTFKQKLKEGKTIGIISEAGCPGVADPGQSLVAIAHEMNAAVKPLVGPNSILLALMASGMNGQRFQFVGYLPIKDQEKVRAIKDLETESQKKNCTQIFIETPYRNNQLLEALLKNCKSSTKLCVAANLTSSNEFIQTKTIAEWRQIKPNLDKQPTTFCILSK